jgi:hypothetical protein
VELESGRVSYLEVILRALEMFEIGDQLVDIASARSKPNIDALTYKPFPLVITDKAADDTFDTRANDKFAYRIGVSSAIWNEFS